MSVDQRGFKTLIQAEAQEFLGKEMNRAIFNSTISFIKHSSKGVQVTLANGEKLKADYAICTFRSEVICSATILRVHLSSV